MPQVESLVREALFRRVLRPLAPIYMPRPALPEHLEVIDLFYLRYSAAAGEQRGLKLHKDGSLFSIASPCISLQLPSAPCVHAGLKLHKDGSLFSFNVLLNEPSAFQGGGTMFEPSGHTVRLERGA